MAGDPGQVTESLAKLGAQMRNDFTKIKLLHHLDKTDKTDWWCKGFEYGLAPMFSMNPDHYQVDW